MMRECPAAMACQPWRAPEGLEVAEVLRTVIQKQGLDRDTRIQELRGLLQAHRGPTPQG